MSRRKDGRWETRYYANTLDGRKRRTLYGKTRKEVANKPAKAIAAQEAPSSSFVLTHITVSGFLDQYEVSAKVTMKRRSFETYQDIARLHLLPTLSGLKLCVNLPGRDAYNPQGGKAMGVLRHFYGYPSPREGKETREDGAASRGPECVAAR